MAQEGGGKIRVFLLDDQAIVRRALKDRLSLETDMEVVGEAGTAQVALRMLPVLRPGVAVLDVRLPDGDGVSVCREIRSSAPEVACLMLTGYSGHRALMGAILAGAAGYVTKDNFADLVSAVRTVAVGESVLDAHAASAAMDLVREQLVHRPGRQLSGQEKRILQLIGEGLTDRDIAQRLAVPEQAAKAQVLALLAKLGLLTTQPAVVGGGRAE